MHGAQKDNAEKEWYEWRGLIEKRLSKDFEDLTKKIQGDYILEKRI